MKIRLMSILGVIVAGIIAVVIVISGHMATENQYNLTHKFVNNRTLETGIIKGVEVNSTPNNRKNSPGWTRTSNPSVNSRVLRH